MSGVLMQEMTWPEIRDALARGKTSVVLAVASVEQHGPALPLNTDEEIGRALAVEVARCLGDALVGPVVVPGCSEHHMAWPGTISLPAEVLVSLIIHYVKSLSRHGFREIILFAAHGGNFGPLAARLEDIRRAARPARVIDLLDAQSLFGAWFEVLRDFGRADRTLPHADVMETSLMMYLRPELVREGRLEVGFTGTFDLEELTRRGLQSFTRNGVLGDPRGASPALGRALIERVGRKMADEIRRRREQS